MKYVKLFNSLSSAIGAGVTSPAIIMFADSKQMSRANLGKDVECIITPTGEIEKKPDPVNYTTFDFVFPAIFQY